MTVCLEADRSVTDVTCFTIPDETQNLRQVYCQSTIVTAENDFKTLDTVNPCPSHKNSILSNLIEDTASNLPPTEHQPFTSNEHPKLCMRLAQQKQEAVWFCLYDEDICSKRFQQKIMNCDDNLLPQCFLTYTVQGFTPIISNQRVTFLQRNDEMFTLARLYLVQIEQLFDIVR